MKIFDIVSWFYGISRTKKNFKKKNYETALEVANFTYDKAVKAFGPKHIKAAQTCYNLVVLNTELGNFEEAEKYGLHALKIMEDLRGESDFSIIQDLRNLQSVYKKWGKSDKVDELEERINKIIDGDEPENENKVGEE